MSNHGLCSRQRQWVFNLCHRRVIVFYQLGVIILRLHTPRTVVLSPARCQGSTRQSLIHPSAWLLRVPIRATKIHLSSRDSLRHGNPSFPSLKSGGSLARPHLNPRFLQTLASYPSRSTSSSKATTSSPPCYFQKPMRQRG